MGKMSLLSASALRSAAFAGAFVLAATPAFAQDAAPGSATKPAPTPDCTAPGTANSAGCAAASTTQDAAAPVTQSDIVVTGSRIRTPNLESAAPVTTLSGEQLLQTGKVQIGDQLNQLPQLRSTFSTANSTRFLGTRGLNLVDLRGLGTQRTLVLVNGRRHVAADVLNNGVSVDINTIPADLIERVDVVTGGASAVYGSDAVAGVVNFILKKNYSGVQLRAQSGLNKYKTAGNQFVSLLAGQNFAGGRGNVVLAAEYSHNDDFYASDVGKLKQSDGFVVIETDPAGSPNGAAGGFDRAYFTDLRSATISLGGMVAIREGASTAPCGKDYLGNAYTCPYIFQPDGTLIPQTGQRVGLAPNAGFSGGNGYSGREGKLIALSPDVKRYSINLLAHYEISPALEPFIEAKYVRVDAKGSQSGPFFSQGQTLGDAICVTGFNDRSYDVGSTGSCTVGRVNREGIRLDNPYLSASAQSTLRTQLLAALNAGINPNTGTAYSSSAAQQAARTQAIAEVNNNTFRFSLRRNYLDLGIRDENFRRETYRVVAGIRGSFWDNFSYELSANYGEHKERNQIQGNIDRQRFLLANDTAVNSSGQIVCRSQIDPNYRGTDRAGDPARLAADIAACVPLNPFGTGNISDAAKNYLLLNTLATGKITQFDVLGYIAGDTGSFFRLPGGPIGFSVGGEYRKETLRYNLDPVTQAGYAFYNAIPSFTSPSFGVKEAFAELNVPLLKNTPLFHELTVKGSGRYSDYKGAAGNVKTYGVEGIWSPIRDITFRGAYNRSVRAPNLSELYSAQGQNFAPGFADPCSQRALATGSATRVANCTAAGRPAGYDYVYSSSLEIVSGGNPNLTVEKSDSFTVGGYLQPRFLPGFSVSTDYYDITVNQVISSIGSAQQIANLCYDSATLNNPFCGLFQRAGASGGPRGEEPFRILEGSLLQSTANFAKLKTRGFDSQINYTHSFGIGRFTGQVIWTHVLKNESYTNPADPTFVDVFLNELGTPKDTVFASLGLKSGKWLLNYSGRWIGGMYLNTYEDYNSVNGQPPQNADYAPIVKYPSVMYHNIRVGYDITPKFNMYVGVDNLTNRFPPYGLTGVGGGSGIYDNRGRYFYTGVVAKF
ncbi:TonB-dependent receptor [Sphingomonas sp. KRR8]|uniref:TonB-dependent receptor domain-containing protein n=1 Tax=Sphingomonas sp. KRR8 TaxID=2942996 RepID=UPI0020223D0D|nr:TonB-dependent receptor [Sphingomonas sp. KRR8]URD61887.1 TonB-dependent receptor [Sphingomonas sp. KRR8]